jgi:sugar-specific transcriptional regulator TrmB
MLKDVLQDCGMSQVQVSVFLLLAQFEEAAASTIARRLNCPRKTAAFNLDQLVKWGFANCKLKKGAYMYRAASSEKLSFLIGEKVKEANSLQTRFNQVVPDLERLKNPEVALPKAEFHLGLQGIKETYEDTIKGNDDIYAFQNAGKMDPSVIEYLAADYLPKRIQKGIAASVIAPKTKAQLTKRKNDKVSNRETRFLDSKFFNELEIEINLYGDKAAFMSYKSEELFGVVIESKAITKSLRALFDYCWQSAK